MKAQDIFKHDPSGRAASESWYSKSRLMQFTRARQVVKILHQMLIHLLTRNLMSLLHMTALLFITMHFTDGKG